MKITPTRTLGAASVRRKSGGPRAKGAGQRFVLDAGADEALPAIATVSPIGSLDGLLAIQEASAVQTEETGSEARGHRLLDRLDEIRLGLLQGGIPRRTLLRLAEEIDARRAEIDDPRLAEILDEIDLRARVELAKYGVPA